MIDRLKQINRTLLELITGILIFALLCQMIVLFIPISQKSFAIGFWTGIILACFCAVHMLRSLNKAFSCDEKTAARVMAGGYIIRYLVIGAILVLLYYTKIGHPLSCFLGVVGLKAGAYFQPVVHKAYNRIFHETDPVAEPISDDEISEEEQEVSEK